MTDCDAWKMHLPNVPLSTLYDHIQRELKKLGVEFRMESRVMEISESQSPASDGTPLRTLRRQSGEALFGRHIVLAVPCWQVSALLPAGWRDAPEVRMLEQIETAPITSVHLWYDRPITDLPHCVLTSRTSQWLFRRPTASTPSPPQSTREFESNVNCGEEGRGEGPSIDSLRNRETLYQVVISNSRKSDRTSSRRNRGHRRGRTPRHIPRGPRGSTHSQ